MDQTNTHLTMRTMMTTFWAKMRRPSTSRIVFAYIALVCLFLLGWLTFGPEHRSLSWDVLYQYSQSYTSAGNNITKTTPNATLTSVANSRPTPSSSQGVRVIGLVFFGRRRYVEILDCYLKRNIKSNGGLLDEVVFAVKTDKKEDLDFLDALVETTPEYTRHDPSGANGGYAGSWEPALAADPEHDIIIKIDDDVVFIEDDTIGYMVERLRNNPSYFGVSANVINNPALSWVHRAMGVYRPYYPEMKAPRETPPKSWKASELPSYRGPAEGPKTFNLDGSTPAPFQGHRWLPVRPAEGEVFDILKTAASFMEYSPFGPSLSNWAIGAQTHYSFLEHLEHEETDRYHFDIWDLNYRRVSINFYGIWARDILESFPFPRDDEQYLASDRPKELGRHVIIEGRGLAVHFAFAPQYNAHDGKALAWTDALDRYKAYAEEMVCPFPNRTGKTGSKMVGSDNTEFRRVKAAGPLK